MYVALNSKENTSTLKPGRGGPRHTFVLCICWRYLGDKGVSSPKDSLEQVAVGPQGSGSTLILSSKCWGDTILPKTSVLNEEWNNTLLWYYLVGEWSPDQHLRVGYSCYVDDSPQPPGFLLFFYRCRQGWWKRSKFRPDGSSYGIRPSDSPRQIGMLVLDKEFAIDWVTGRSGHNALSPWLEQHTAACSA